MTAPSSNNQDSPRAQLNDLIQAVWGGVKQSAPKGGRKGPLVLLVLVLLGLAGWTALLHRAERFGGRGATVWPLHR